MEDAAAGVWSALGCGQFELARALMGRIGARGSSVSAVDILRAVLRHGPAAGWAASAAVPSTAHLLWLCLTELGVLMAAAGGSDAVSASAVADAARSAGVDETGVFRIRLEMALWELTRGRPHAPLVDMWRSLASACHPPLSDAVGGCRAGNSRPAATAPRRQR